MPSDPLSRPRIEIERVLRERRASARELIEAAIARHERFGERLHTYSFWAPDQARVVAEAADAAFSAGGVDRPTPGAAHLGQGPVRRWRISLLRRVEPAPADRSLGAGRAIGRDVAPPVGRDHGQDPFMVEFAFGGTGRHRHGNSSGVANRLGCRDGSSLDKAIDQPEGGHRGSLTGLHCESQTGKRSLCGRRGRPSWSSLAVRSRSRTPTSHSFRKPAIPSFTW
jgi:hypothetical protein